MPPGPKEEVVPITTEELLQTIGGLPVPMELALEPTAGTHIKFPGGGIEIGGGHVLDARPTAGEPTDGTNIIICTRKGHSTEISGNDVLHWRLRAGELTDKTNIITCPGGGDEIGGSNVSHEKPTAGELTDETDMFIWLEGGPQIGNSKVLFERPTAEEPTAEEKPLSGEPPTKKAKHSISSNSKKDDEILMPPPSVPEAQPTFKSIFSSSSNSISDSTAVAVRPVPLPVKRAPIEEDTELSDSETAVTESDSKATSANRNKKRISHKKAKAYHDDAGCPPRCHGVLHSNKKLGAMWTIYVDYRAPGRTASKMVYNNFLTPIGCTNPLCNHKGEFCEAKQYALKHKSKLPKVVTALKLSHLIPKGYLDGWKDK